MSSPVDIAIGLGAALLPPLVAEIQAALEEGLTQEQATQRALERMRAVPLPDPVSGEIARRFALARAALQPPIALPPVHVADLGTLELLVRSPALSHEERGALTRASALVRASLAQSP